MNPDENLQRLGLELPEVPEPVGTYVPAMRAGRLVFTAGQIPLKGDMLVAVGSVPTEASVEQAEAAARQCTLNALAAVRSVAGSLDVVARVVRMNVYVQSAEGFAEQSEVANAASGLLGEVFGEAGRHSRCAIGVAELPRNATVELDLIVELTAEA